MVRSRSRAATSRDDEIGGLAVVGDGDIEMIHARANIVNDRGDLGATVGQTLADHEYPHRLIEFANAFRRRAELQFGD